MYEVGTYIIEQALVVGDYYGGVLRGFKLVDASCHYAQRVYVEAGVCLVEDAEARFEHRHLENLVALLLSVLAGDPRYTVTGGSATFHGVDLLSLAPENRSHEGLFLSFQYPVEIPGVSTVNFMRAAIGAHYGVDFARPHFEVDAF